MIKTSAIGKNRKRLKILFVSFTFLDMTLHKNALLQMLEKLSDFDHRVSLVAVRSRENIAKNAKIDLLCFPTRYVPFISPLFFSIFLIFYLPFIALREKLDFIVFDPDIHIMSFFPVSFVSKFTKTNFILDIRTVIVEAKGIRGALKNFWFSVSVLIAKKKFTGITIITDSMKKKIATDFRLNLTNIGVWTSGVSEDLFNPKTNCTYGLALRQQYGLTGKFAVFYHGIFTPTRGLSETIKAIKLLKPKHPAIIFFLLGTGPMKRDLAKLIEQEDLQTNVIIADPVDQAEVPKYISMCDLGIIPLPDHPYWRFQSPLKLLEYLAMEKVVVATDIIAHRAVLHNAKCGIYISSIDPLKIAEGIEYAYLNRANLSAWGKTGREIVQNHYTWEKVALDFENYLLAKKKSG